MNVPGAWAVRSSIECAAKLMLCTQRAAHSWSCSECPLESPWLSLGLS